MINSDSLKKLYDFFINLKQAPVDTGRYKIDIFEKYVTGPDAWIAENDAYNIAHLKSDTDTDIEKIAEVEWVRYLLHIGTILVRWLRYETKPLEGSILGGCTFNYLASILSKKDSEFWERSHGKFVNGELPQQEIDMVKKLRWFEAPAAPSESLYTPMYGCVLYEEDKLPEQFFFYDSGYIFPMKIDSYGGYIEALSATAAVYCWQYFYIQPELIIAKYKGVCPDTIFISNASFFNPEMRRYVSDNIGAVPDRYPAFENGRARFWDEDNTIDRVDVIAEYLERCIRLLPGTFPFLDFTHHKDYYEKFIALYKASKE